MLLWLQRSDFSSDETQDATLESALEQFAAFDWATELNRFEQAEKNDEECCEPGIGLVQGDAHILHLCPQTPEVGSVFYHYRRPAKALGIIPYLSSETVQAYQFPLTQTKELFATHFANDQTATLALLQPYESAEES